MVADNTKKGQTFEQKRAVMIESVGHALHCGQHDYWGKNIEDFQRHLDEDGHYVIGGNPKCFQCGKTVALSVIKDGRYEHNPDVGKFTNKQVREGKVFHKQCRKEFLKELD